MLAVMTIHYHALPITPNPLLWQLAGLHTLVSYSTTAQQQMYIADEVSQSVIIDPGAFTIYQQIQRDETLSEEERETRLHTPRDWSAYYAWCEPWLERPTTYAVIPDMIGAARQMQDAYLKEWPHGKSKGIPVFHIHHHEDHLLRLLDEYEYVAMGSSGEFWDVLSDDWLFRMDDLRAAIQRRHRFMPKMHLFRGMQVVLHPECPISFFSTDSSDVGRNHNRPQNNAADMVKRWDAKQFPRLSLPLQRTKELFA